MNIGIYINDMANLKHLQKISQSVDKLLRDDSIYDVSLFYDNIAFNPELINCGTFNSTELWSFSGNLIVSSLGALGTALNIINKVNIFFYYEKEENMNIINLIMSTKNNVNIICSSQSEADEVYRLTGKKSFGIANDYYEIVNLIGKNNEYKSNNNNVYQTA